MRENDTRLLADLLDYVRARPGAARPAQLEESPEGRALLRELDHLRPGSRGIDSRRAHPWLELIGTSVALSCHADAWEAARWEADPSRLSFVGSGGEPATAIWEIGATMVDAALGEREVLWLRAIPPDYPGEVHAVLPGLLLVPFDFPDEGTWALLLRGVREVDPAGAGERARQALGPVLRRARELFARESELQRRQRALDMVAHDLRSPLNGILGLLELMLEEPARNRAKGKSEREVLQLVHRTCQALQAMVGDITEASHLREGILKVEPQQVNVGEALAAVLELNRRLAAEKSLRFEVAMSKEAGTAWVDPGRLRQIADNLLNNAIKYSHEGGRIALDVSRRGPELVLTVRDEGVGIAENELGAIFEPYARARGRPTGGEPSSGLGLTIVKHLVEAHGGRIEVSSTEGEGTIFTARFPQDGSGSEASGTVEKAG